MATDNHTKTVTVLEIFLVFLRLGFTSFGGPIAHIGYFRQEFVEQRKWLDEHAYADLVALCQFLPGPASSQIGIALGLSRGGFPGAIASWLGFTLPSAIALVLFGMGLSVMGNTLGDQWLHGLKVVAVAVVAQALWGMGKSLCPDKLRASFAVCAATTATIFPSSLGQITVIAASALFGWLLLRTSTALPHNLIQTTTSRITGMILLSVFFLFLLVLPLAAAGSGSYTLKLFDSFYRSGSLVFGGGHVVLPLLQSQVVPTGWISNDLFLAGYGAAQAVPGPLFTLAAYLGAMSSQSPFGWPGAGIALVAIFLPAFLLIAGTLPFWEHLRRYETMQRAMLGINAGVVGILLAAFYNPVWTSAIRSSADFSLAMVAFLLLVFWKCSPWLVVLLAATVTGLGI
ncbi:MAG: chromate transporter [Geobacteraceae bacterium GWC2_53_11]|nr:MAG: chromate transporter [Geobacteraceae bacterium GWC2_53_11]